MTDRDYGSGYGYPTYDPTKNSTVGLPINYAIPAVPTPGIPSSYPSGVSPTNAPYGNAVPADFTAASGVTPGSIPLPTNPPYSGVSSGYAAPAPTTAAPPTAIPGVTTTQLPAVNPAGPYGGAPTDPTGTPPAGTAPFNQNDIGYVLAHFHDAYLRAMQRAGYNPLATSPMSQYVQQQMYPAESQMMLDLASGNYGGGTGPVNADPWLDRFMQSGGRAIANPQAELQQAGSFISDLDLMGRTQAGQATPESEAASKRYNAFAAQSPIGASTLMKLNQEPYELSNLFANAMGPNPFASQLGRYYSGLLGMAPADQPPLSYLTHRLYG